MALFGALQGDGTGARPFPGGLDVLPQALPTPSAQGARVQLRIPEAPMRSWAFHSLRICSGGAR